MFTIVVEYSNDGADSLTLPCNYTDEIPYMFDFIFYDFSIVRIHPHIFSVDFHQTYTSLHRLHVTTRHYTLLHVTIRHYTSLHVTTRHYTSLHLTTRHYTPLHINTRHYTSLHVTTRHYTSLHISTRYYTSPHVTTRHHKSIHVTTRPSTDYTSKVFWSKYMNTFSTGTPKDLICSRLQSLKGSGQPQITPWFLKSESRQHDCLLACLLACLID